MVISCTSDVWRSPPVEAIIGGPDKRRSRGRHHSVIQYVQGQVCVQRRMHAQGSEVCPAGNVYSVSSAAFNVVGGWVWLKSGCRDDW